MRKDQLPEFRQRAIGRRADIGNIRGAVGDSLFSGEDEIKGGLADEARAVVPGEDHLFLFSAALRNAGGESLACKGEASKPLGQGEGDQVHIQVPERFQGRAAQRLALGVIDPDRQAGQYAAEIPQAFDQQQGLDFIFLGGKEAYYKFFLVFHGLSL